jgi:hypothetical protein
MEGGIKLIDQRKVNIFCKRRALIKKLQKDDKKDTDEIIKLFKNGYGCPVEGPWLAELSAMESPDLSWREMYEQDLIEKYEKKYKDREMAEMKAKAVMKKMQDEAEKKPVVKILCKDNPAYKREKTSAAA